MMRRRILVLAIVAGMLVGGSIGVAVSAGTEDISGVRPNGTVTDESALPDSLPVLDCLGRVVGVRNNPFSDSAKAYTPAQVRGAGCEVPTVETAYEREP
jgi:hypothetical protein